MNEIMDLQLYQLLAAYIFILILLAIVRLRNLDHEREIIIATIRMTIQLVLVGYLLNYVFDQNNYLFTLLIIIIMESFAIYNIYQRVTGKINTNLKLVIAVAMLSGTLISIFFFLVVVINLKPWYYSRYFIPISGMLIGNSMTGISLGVQRLISGIKEQQDQIRAALMLGVTPERATEKIVNQAFSSAILPTINSMMGMGIVFLPGMMTGQILSGVSPLVAIRYQIAIMMGITGSVSLTIIIFIHLGYKTFFNDRAQLDIEN
jgi:putative ABC transport system permease protein